MKCEGCGSEACRPALFRLCQECEGKGCPICKESLVPGVLPTDNAHEPHIRVCSEWQDPEVEASMNGTHVSLKAVVAHARDRLMRE